MKKREIQEVKLSDLSQEQIVKTIFKLYSKGRISGKIKSKFLDWLTDEDLLEIKEEALRQLWNNTDSKSSSTTRKSLKKVKERLEMQSHQMRKLAPSKSRIWLRVAAVATPLLIIAGYVSTLVTGESPIVAESKQMEVYVDNGNQETVLLADGSKAVLNAGTHFSYPEEFFPEKERIVKLEGEGFFDVVSDGRPFIVEAGEITVRVLGTEFNVKAYADESEVSIALLSGAVETNIAGNTLLLKENEKIIYNRESQEITHATTSKESELAWTRGELNIEHKTLEEIFKMCERRFGVEIVTNTEISDQTYYSTRFVAEYGLEDVLIVLENMTGIFSFSIDGETVLIEMK